MIKSKNSKEIILEILDICLPYRHSINSHGELYGFGLCLLNSLPVEELAKLRLNNKITPYEYECAILHKNHEETNPAL